MLDRLQKKIQQGDVIAFSKVSDKLSEDKKELFRVALEHGGRNNSFKLQENRFCWDISNRTIPEMVDSISLELFKQKQKNHPL